MTVSASLLAEANKVRSSRLWYWLYEIELSTTTTESRWALLTSHDEGVTFASQSYAPFPISLKDVDSGHPSDLRPVSLIALDLDGTIRAYTQAYDLRGNRVVVRLVHEDLLASAVDGHATTYEIKHINHDPDAGTVSLELGHLSLHDLFVPSERISRLSCPYRFAGPRCGVDPGSDTRGCDRSLDGPNGCSTWDNVARFGGRPSTPGRR